MTKDEALKLALEALEGIHPGNMTPMAEEYWNKAITAIKQALAAPVQEPVATNKIYVTREQLAELYPPPAAQPAVPLTDEQIEHLWETRVSQPCPSYPLEKSDWVQFARAIEAAHGITKGQP
jgi:hypothetical protein